MNTQQEFGSEVYKKVEGHPEIKCRFERGEKCLYLSCHNSIAQASFLEAYGFNGAARIRRLDGRESVVEITRLFKSLDEIEQYRHLLLLAGERSKWDLLIKVWCDEGVRDVPKLATHIGRSARGLHSVVQKLLRLGILR